MNTVYSIIIIGFCGFQLIVANKYFWKYFLVPQKIFLYYITYFYHNQGFNKNLVLTVAEINKYLQILILICTQVDAVKLKCFNYIYYTLLLNSISFKRKIVYICSTAFPLIKENITLSPLASSLPRLFPSSDVSIMIKNCAGKKTGDGCSSVTCVQSEEQSGN